MTTVSTMRSPQSNSAARDSAMHGAGPLQPLQNKTKQFTIFSLHLFIFKCMSILPYREQNSGPPQGPPVFLINESSFQPP